MALLKEILIGEELKSIKKYGISESTQICNLTIGDLACIFEALNLKHIAHTHKSIPVIHFLNERCRVNKVVFI